MTSLSAEGIGNVAPFSFFNAIGSDPPMIVLGLVAHPERRFKDPERIALDIPAMRLISRLHGAGYYGRQTDMFEMLRPPRDPG